MAEFKRTWDKCASAINNGDFILIETWSGNGMTGSDPKGKQFFLNLDANDYTLGKAVIETLSVSRILTIEEAYDFFDYKWREEIYKEWVQFLMNRYGYKTKRALFKNMNDCAIWIFENKITFHPKHHEKLEAWGATENGTKDDVIIPADSKPEEIGAALRLAFSRCTGGL